MKNKPSEEQIQHIAKVYHGCVADGLEWAMAHLDYLDDADKIRITLLELGYTEMANTWDELLVIFDCMSSSTPRHTYTGKLQRKIIPSNAALELFKDVENKAKASGVIERFCVKSKPTLVEKFGAF